MRLIHRCVLYSGSNLASNRVKPHVCPFSSLCLSLPLASLLPASIHPAFSILLPSLTSTQGESADWSQAQRGMRDMRFKTFSWRAFLWHVSTLFPLLCLFTRSTSPEALLSFALFHTFISTGGTRVIFLHIFICALTPITPSLLCTFSIPSFSATLYLCMHVSLSLPFITRAVKSDRLDKCGSMVTQIPAASERATINHFSPLLSSAISLPLCSPLFLPSIFLLFSSQHPLRHHYLLNVIQHFLF